MKRWAKILIVIAVVLVAAVAAIPLFVNANTFRPAIERELASTLGRNVKVGDLSLSVFSGRMLSKDLSVADDPSFSATPFLTAKTLRIGVSLRALVFSHELELRERADEGVVQHRHYTTFSTHSAACSSKAWTRPR